MNEAKINNRLSNIIIGSLFIIMGVLFVAELSADEIKHKFKNPSFSGSGTGAHYLTIENQEKGRRDKIKSDIEEALRRAEREDANSTINKFIRNLESRIYSQISKGLVDSIQAHPGTTSTRPDSIGFYKGTTVNNIIDREHVTFYFWKYGNDFKLAQLSQKNDWSKYRITIDYPEDYEVIKFLIFELKKNDCEGTLNQIIKILIKYPEIFSLNSKYYYGIGWEGNNEVN